MSDTQRTRAAILAFFADNTSGNITPQNLRDFVVTLMDPDFAYPGDFWTQPRAGVGCTMVDKTVKGWCDYSQIITSAISFGHVLYLTASGWVPATASLSTANAVLGVAGSDYASAESQATVLRWGLVYNSDRSAQFSGNVGKLLYLQTTSQMGSISVTPLATSARAVGYVELSVFGDVTSGKWRFEPSLWGVAGT